MERKARPGERPGLSRDRVQVRVPKGKSPAILDRKKKGRAQFMGVNNNKGKRLGGGRQKL